MKIGMVAGSFSRRQALLCGVVYLSSAAAWADGAKPESSAAQQYHLRYKFQTGDVLRWTVVHRCRVRTSVSASTQTAETTTTSVKVWRVHEVKPDGSVVFDHSVECVDMRHHLSGRDEVHYNSRTDPCAPPWLPRRHRPGDRRAIGADHHRRSGQSSRRHQNFVGRCQQGRARSRFNCPSSPLSAVTVAFSNQIELPAQRCFAADPPCKAQAGKRSYGRPRFRWRRS